VKLRRCTGEGEPAPEIQSLPVIPLDRNANWAGRKPGLGSDQKPGNKKGRTPRVFEVRASGQHKTPRANEVSTMSNSRRKTLVNSRGASRLTLPELEVRILEYQRQAVHRHFAVSEWVALDRLRKWRAQRRKEAGM
jgi:hypothetical protein